MPPQNPQKPLTTSDWDTAKPITTTEWDASKPVAPDGPKTRSPGFATFADALISRNFGQVPMGNFGLGMAKGGANTVTGLLQLANRAVGSPVSNDAIDQFRADVTTPTNPAQSAGKFVEQTGEFFFPGGQVARGVKAVETGLQGMRGAKTVTGLTRAFLEGGSAAGAHAAQTGSAEGALGVGMTGATGSIGAQAVGKGLSFLGERIENALVKASTADVKDGFLVGNIFKHRLGGTLQQTLTKSDTKLDELGTQMQAELSRLSATGQAPRVDVLGVINSVEQKFLGNASRNTGSNAAIQRAIAEIKDDIAQQSKNALFPGLVDLPTANKMKQGIGELGAWQFGKADPDSAAKEMVANAIYRELRQSIEKSVVNPGRLKELNKAMGEIIPIRQAIIRRIPVAQRANPIRLTDVVGLAAGSYVLPLAERILRAGQTANLASHTGNVLSNTGGIGTGVASLGSEIIR